MGEIMCGVRTLICSHPHTTHEVRLNDPEVNAHRSSHTFIYCSVVREINKINERELELGVGTASWHDEYKGRTGTGTITLFGAHDTSDSAYIFIGGLHYGLTEGDVISIFSQ
jgi:hypothetical protein